MAPPSRPHVLVLDDEVACRLVMRDLLEPHGFEVVEAASAEAGLALLEKRLPDVIVSDVSMGAGISGVELCRRLKAREETRYVPFIAVTGCDATEERVAGLEAGADDYLPKPIEPAELLARVRSAIRLGAYERILAEREKLRAVTSEMSDGLVVMTPDWRLVSANDAASRLLATVEPGTDLLEAAARRFETSIEPALLRSGTARELRFELVRRAGGGPALVLSAALTRLAPPGGAAGELVLALRDVTAERAEARLKDDFVSLASHKLRTPLTILAGNLEMLSDGTLGGLSGDQSESIAAMSHGVAELGRLVERLIHFADAGRSDRRLRPEPASFDAMARRVREAVETRAVARGGLRCEIVLEAPREDAWAALVDPRAWREIADAIADNAVKFCDKPSLVLRIAASVCDRGDVEDSPGDGLVRLAIRDNGVGLPHELAEAVFETFRQHEEDFTGNVEGFGLGLPLVRRLVARSGGRVAIRSEVGRGAEVIVDLPEAK